ncbi:MAG: hypothetical protein COW84_08090 [Gammaproteobacteria bacterium CG22_combo_CG10-13_8_21_14_all_40_8]|nr:MAG: hypothetical protein COW84_08090 [Gammaproteobacteria bacterium CG22_combo_CG10-13_8_21_14_all_40_8]
MAIKNPVDSSTYNLGYGKGYSINEVIDIARKVCKQPFSIEYLDRRNVDVNKIILDTKKIQHQLNWLPKVSLEEGIAKIWRAIRK